MLLGALIGVRALDPFPIEILRLKVFDYYQQLLPRSPAASPVVIVDIDEASLTAFGQWPWPRTLLAELVERLVRNGAAVVGFDILFAERDRWSPELFAQGTKGLPPGTAEILAKLPDNDRVLAKSMAGARVVLGLAATNAKRPSGQTREHKTPVAFIGGDPKQFLRPYDSVISNLRELDVAAKGRGMLTLEREVDGVVRRVPAVVRVRGDVYPSFALEILRVATGQTTYAVKSNKAGIDSVVISRARIPTDRKGRIWLNFAPSDGRRYVSAREVLENGISPEKLFGKLVLIGTSAAGLADIKFTPVSQHTPGVEIHAQLLETFFEGSHLTRPNYALGAEVVLLLATSLIVIVLVPKLGAWWTLMTGALFTSALIAGSWHLYQNERQLFDVTYPIVGSALLFLFLTFMNYAKEEAERRQIRTAFSRYLSPDVVSRLAQNPSQLRLGGENREMTLMFVDVHGFTTISESYDAEELTNLVNKVLTPLTVAVLESGGTVDKYMGDSVMAFWNAPLDDADHARHACLAALRIQTAMGPLNQALQDEANQAGRDFQPVKVGIGINTGICCVGNMGSELRFDYSVLGDPVNAASRLEGLTRTYRVANIVGEATYNLARDFAFLEVDLVRVLGKSIPMRIFTNLGQQAVAESEDFIGLAEAHERMIHSYRAGAWERALQEIDICRDRNPNFDIDGLYEQFADRIGQLIDDPPAPAWDGVFQATTKG